MQIWVSKLIALQNYRLDFCIKSSIDSSLLEATIQYKNNRFCSLPRKLDSAESVSNSEISRYSSYFLINIGMTSSMKVPISNISLVEGYDKTYRFFPGGSLNLDTRKMPKIADSFNIPQHFDSNFQHYGRHSCLNGFLENWKRFLQKLK